MNASEINQSRRGKGQGPSPRAPREAHAGEGGKGELCAVSHATCVFFHEEHSFYFVLISFWKSLIFSDGQVNTGYLENTRMNTKVIILLPKKTTINIRTLSSYFSIHLSPASL